MKRVHIKWTGKEKELIRKYYRIELQDKLMEMLPNRTWESIRVCANKMGMTRNGWTDEELALLTEYYPKIERYEEIEKLLPKRGIVSVRAMACRLGIKREHITYIDDWADEELNVLDENYPKTGVKKVEELLPNRTFGGISRMASIRNLKLEAFPQLPERLTEQQYQLVIGSLFGDASITPTGGSDTHHYNCYFRVGHRIEDKEYLLWKYHILEPFCSNKAIYTTKTKYIKKNGEHSVIMRMLTRTSPIFTELRETFYDKTKISPEEKLYELNDLGLAIWFMDDGCYNKKRSMLCTHCFTMEEKKGIASYFKSVWGISSGIAKDNSGYYTFFNTENTKKLVEIIKPYIVPCMIRKIGGINKKWV